MTEKVVLTKEQAEVIEMAKTRKEIDWLLEDSKSDWMFEYRSLNGLTTSQLARAFYIGYEIEPEKPKFQPGDRVVRIDGREFANFEKIGNVYREEDSGQIVLLKGPKGYRDMPQQWTPDIIRHATPEEIYWLEMLGRDAVLELHLGDVIVNAFGDVAEVVDNVDRLDAMTRYKKGDFSGLYPANSFKPYPEEESNS